LLSDKRISKSGDRMYLTKLIDEFHETNTVICQIIETQQKEQELEDHDKHMVEVLNAIKGYKPRTPEELKIKLSFFVERLQNDVPNHSDSFAIKSLTHILLHDFANKKEQLTNVANGNYINCDENNVKLAGTYDLV